MGFCGRPGGNLTEHYLTHETQQIRESDILRALRSHDTGFVLFAIEVRKTLVSEQLAQEAARFMHGNLEKPEPVRAELLRAVLALQRAAGRDAWSVIAWNGDQFLQLKAALRVLARCGCMRGAGHAAAYAGRAADEAKTAADAATVAELFGAETAAALARLFDEDAPATPCVSFELCADARMLATRKLLQTITDSRFTKFCYRLSPIERKIVQECLAREKYALESVNAVVAVLLNLPRGIPASLDSDFWAQTGSAGTGALERSLNDRADQRLFVALLYRACLRVSDKSRNLPQILGPVYEAAWLLGKPALLPQLLPQYRDEREALSPYVLETLKTVAALCPTPSVIPPDELYRMHTFAKHRRIRFLPWHSIEFAESLKEFTENPEACWICSPAAAAWVVRQTRPFTHSDFRRIVACHTLTNARGRQISQWTRLYNKNVDARSSCLAVLLAAAEMSEGIMAAFSVKLAHVDVWTLAALHSRALVAESLLADDDYVSKLDKTEILVLAAIPKQLDRIFAASTASAMCKLPLLAAIGRLDLCATILQSIHENAKNKLSMFVGNYAYRCIRAGFLELAPWLCNPRVRLLAALRGEAELRGPVKLFGLNDDIAALIRRLMAIAPVSKFSVNDYRFGFSTTQNDAAAAYAEYLQRRDGGLEAFARQLDAHALHALHQHVFADAEATVFSLLYSRTSAFTEFYIADLCWTRANCVRCFRGLAQHALTFNKAALLHFRPKLYALSQNPAPDKIAQFVREWAAGRVARKRVQRALLAATFPGYDAASSAPEVSEVCLEALAIAVARSK